METEFKKAPDDEETDNEAGTGTYGGVIETKNVSAPCNTKNVLSPLTELETEEVYQHREAAILPLLTLVMDYLRSYNNSQCSLSPQQYLSEHRWQGVPDRNLWGVIRSTAGRMTDTNEPGTSFCRYFLIRPVLCLFAVAWVDGHLINLM